ncbi:MAG: hypothetical protein IPJ07_01235 [Acidobacteria bacterium]|nr:hypothetical protein [Acidobacteriota bacterium]
MSSLAAIGAEGVRDAQGVVCPSVRRYGKPVGPVMDLTVCPVPCGRGCP